MQQQQQQSVDKKAAVPIIVPNNHKLDLQLDVLKEILEADELRDHYAVVVSVTGALRTGKSFLLNFFLKYLNAKYKKCNVKNWMGKTLLNGFKWRGGRKPETMGIWMWPDVFTHVSSNGDKLAIILLDTQGLFDDKSSLSDCNAIFSISMLISSVLCYNLKDNVRENDLHNLDMFMEYGRHATKQPAANLSEELVFIIRDWAHANENNYGESGTFVQKLLKESESNEMRELTDRIRSNFDTVKAYLMPHPGLIVSQGNAFDGKLSQIEADFLETVKMLAPSLLAPTNLVVKKINGKMMRPSDLIPYLQGYVNTFNSNELPKCENILMANGQISNEKLYTECLNDYVESMERTMNADTSFISQSFLASRHTTNATRVISQYEKARKIGDDAQITSFKYKLIKDINQKYESFKQRNEQRRLLSAESKEQELLKLRQSVMEKYVSTWDSALEKSRSHYIENVDDIHREARRITLDYVNSYVYHKIGDIKLFRSLETQVLDGIRQKHQFYIAKNRQSFNQLNRLMDTEYKDRVDSYETAMGQAVKPKPTYQNTFTGSPHHEIISEDDLKHIHNDQVNIALASLRAKLRALTDYTHLTSPFERKLKDELEKKWKFYEQKRFSNHFDYMMDSYVLPIGKVAVPIAIALLFRRPF